MKRRATSARAAKLAALGQRRYEENEIGNDVPPESPLQTNDSSPDPEEGYQAFARMFDTITGKDFKRPASTPEKSRPILTARRMTGAAKINLNPNSKRVGNMGSLKQTSDDTTAATLSIPSAPSTPEAEIVMDSESSVIASASSLSDKGENSMDSDTSGIASASQLGTENKLESEISSRFTSQPGTENKLESEISKTHTSCNLSETGDKIDSETLGRTSTTSPSGPEVTMELHPDIDAEIASASTSSNLSELGEKMDSEESGIVESMSFFASKSTTSILNVTFDVMETSGLNESFGNLSLLETTQDVNGDDVSSKNNESHSTSIQLPSVTFLGNTNEDVIADVLASVNVTQGSSFLVLPTDEIPVIDDLNFTATNNNEELAAGPTDKEPEDGANGEMPNGEQNTEDSNFNQNGEVPHDDPNHQDSDYEPTDDEAYPKPRSSKPDSWKRNKVKKLKDLGLAHTSLKGKERQARAMSNGCTDKCKKKCHFTFNEDVRQNIFNNFWAIGDHTKQWYFIASHIQSCNVKRRTTVLDPSQKAYRQFSYFYYLPLDGAEKPVCLTFFLGTLGINAKWVRTAMAKQKTNHGVVPDDRRGKNKKPTVVSTIIRKDVMDHIKKFKTVEGHYTRKDSKSRYLPESLNVRKMHSMYLIEKQAANITKNVATVRQYRDTFRKEFNLKFFKPKKDQCPRCLSWKNKTPREKTEERKQKFEKHLSDKKLADDLKRADLQKIDDSPEQMKDVCILTCDLEKVLLCPKGNNGDFYYSSKISVYNFTIFVSGEQKGCCYVWDQTEARRGAADIASSLWSFIKRKVEMGVKEFHIYSDNCAAQNKNQFLFSMYVMASIRFNIKIMHRYLEVGHTHMEVDSIHACIENSVRYTDIFVPSQWYTAIRMAKKKAPLYEVIELTQEGVFDFEPLADLLRWKNVGTSLFKEVCMDGAEPGVIRFKKEYEQEPTTLSKILS